MYPGVRWTQLSRQKINPRCCEKFQESYNKLMDMGLCEIKKSTMDENLRNYGELHDK